MHNFNIKISKKSFIWVSLLLFLLIVAYLFPSIMHYVSHDSPQFDDSDLAITEIPIPSETENGYFDLIRVSETLYNPDRLSISQVEDNSLWNENNVNAVLQKNQEVFQLFSQASKKTFFQDPFYLEDHPDSGREHPHLSDWRSGAQISALHALHLARQGNIDKGFLEAFQLVSLGRTIWDSHTPFIDKLIAQSIRSHGFESIQSILKTNTVPSTQLIQYAKQLDDVSLSKDGLIDVFKYEYRFFTKILAELASNPEEGYRYFSISGDDTVASEYSKVFENKYWFKPNQTKQLYAENIRNNIELNLHPCHLDQPEYTPTRLNMSNPIALHFTENMAGKVLFDVTALYLSTFRLKQCNDEMLLRATQLMLGLKAYHTSTNTLPESLDVLVPQYLASVPNDPYSNEQFKYDPVQKVIYSVGENQDNQGDDNNLWWSNNEYKTSPTFSVAFN